MDNEIAGKIAKAVAHMAAAQNRGLTESLSLLVEVCEPIDMEARDRLYLQTHHALYEMRSELPYYIPKPPMEV